MSTGAYLVVGTRLPIIALVSNIKQMRGGAAAAARIRGTRRKNDSLV